MAAQPSDRRVQSLIVLAEAKSGEMPGGDGRVVVERADGYGGHPGFDRDVAAEILIGAVEAQWSEIGSDEVSAMCRQDLEADLGQRVRQLVALALHVAGQARVIIVIEPQPG